MNGFRKYSLAAYAVVASSVLCWFSHITGGEWVAAVSLVIAGHGTANIIDKKFGGAG